MDGMGCWDGSGGVGDLGGAGQGAPTRAVGGRVPLGLVTPALPLVLLVWGWRGHMEGAQWHEGEQPPSPPAPRVPHLHTIRLLVQQALSCCEGRQCQCSPWHKGHCTSPQTRPFPATQPEPTLGAGSTCHPVSHDERGVPILGEVTILEGWSPCGEGCPHSKGVSILRGVPMLGGVSPTWRGPQPQEGPHPGRGFPNLVGPPPSWWVSPS